MTPKDVKTKDDGTLIVAEQSEEKDKKEKERADKNKEKTKKLKKMQMVEVYVTGSIADSNKTVKLDTSFIRINEQRKVS